MHPCVCQVPKSDKFAVLPIYDHNISKWVIILKCKVVIENYLQFIFFAFLVEVYSVGLQFEHCVLLYVRWSDIKKIISISKAAFPIRENMPACAVQVLLQSHNAVSKTWPCIHSYGPLCTPVLSINSAGKKSCRLHRDVGGKKDFLLLCCTRQNNTLLWGMMAHVCFALLLSELFFMCWKKYFHCSFPVFIHNSG